jgi:DNA-binding LacI/PurR family transcriptional regulator
MNILKPTLIDVARAAGVSRSTASNVFAHPERVRAELRARVEAAAQELGYGGPDPTGRLLRSGKVNAIGFKPPAEMGVGDSFRNPVFLQFLAAVGDVCEAHGAGLMVLSDAKRDSIRTALVDAFIFSRVDQLSDVEPALLRRLPFVMVDVEAGPDSRSVRVDSRGGARAAAEHLLGLGHRRFAILSFLRAFGPTRLHPAGGPRPPEVAGMPTDQEKLAGYAEALAAAGLSLDAVPIVQADPWAEDAAGMLLDHAPGATAVLTMGVMQGLRVLAEARRRGIAVPRDLSVVAFNDLPEAARSEPGLTTVDGRTGEKGRVAAELVLEGGPPRQVVLPTGLILRGSTGPAPG